MKIHLIAAPASGLQDAEKTGTLHIRDGLVRNAALASAFARAFGKGRDQCARASYDLIRLGRAGWDLSGRVHARIGH
jgi:hypothetical protein